MRMVSVDSLRSVSKSLLYFLLLGIPDSAKSDLLVSAGNVSSPLGEAVEGERDPESWLAHRTNNQEVDSVISVDKNSFSQLNHEPDRKHNSSLLLGQSSSPVRREPDSSIIPANATRRPIDLPVPPGTFRKESRGSDNLTDSRRPAGNGSTFVNQQGSVDVNLKPRPGPGTSPMLAASSVPQFVNGSQSFASSLSGFSNNSNSMNFQMGNGPTLANVGVMNSQWASGDQEGGSSGGSYSGGGDSYNGRQGRSDDSYDGGYGNQLGGGYGRSGGQGWGAPSFSFQMPPIPPIPPMPSFQMPLPPPIPPMPNLRVPPIPPFPAIPPMPIMSVPPIPAIPPMPIMSMPPMPAIPPMPVMNMPPIPPIPPMPAFSFPSFGSGWG